MAIRDDTSRNDPRIKALLDLFREQPEKVEIARKVLSQNGHATLVRILPYLENDKPYSQVALELGLSKQRVSQMYFKLARKAPILIKYRTTNV
jgi:hypothetical protein